MKNKYKDLQYYKFCANCFFHSLKFFQPLLLLFLKQASLSYTQIGFLYSFREISQNTMEIPSSIIADSYGRKTILIMSSLFFVSSFVIFLLFDSFRFFIIAMIFMGMARAFRSGTHNAMINQHMRENNLENNRIEYLAGTRGAAQVGFALSSLLSGVIVFLQDNISSVFAASILPHTANILLLLSYPKNLNRFNHKEKPDFIKALKSSLKMLKKPNLIRFFLFAAVFSASYEIIRDYIQVIIKKLVSEINILQNLTNNQKTAVFLGLVYFILYMISAVSMKLSSRLNKTRQPHSYWINIFFIMISTIILCIGISLKFRIYSAVISLFIFIFIIRSFRTPIYLNYLMKSIPDENMATGLAANHQTRSILGAILAPLFGFIADNYNLHGAFIFLGIFMIISYFILRIKD